MVVGDSARQGCQAKCFHDTCWCSVLPSRLCSSPPPATIHQPSGSCTEHSCICQSIATFVRSGYILITCLLTLLKTETNSGDVSRKCPQGWKLWPIPHERDKETKDYLGCFLFITSHMVLCFRFSLHQNEYMRQNDNNKQYNNVLC